MRIIQVKVEPHSSGVRLEALNESHWLAQFKSPSVDGKVNQERITLIARHFEVQRAKVSIKSVAARDTKSIAREP